MSEFLGAGWYEPHGGVRWMGRRAEVILAAPRSSGERLRVAAIHSEHPAAGAVTLTVSVNGVAAGRAQVRDNSTGEHVFPVPGAAAGREKMTVTLETSRTFRVTGDDRDLGLAFGIVELLP